jgi:hypothetical protein
MVLPIPWHLVGRAPGGEPGRRGAWARRRRVPAAGPDGTAVDVTVGELRLEAFLPADQATAPILTNLGQATPRPGCAATKQIRSERSPRAHGRRGRLVQPSCPHTQHHGHPHSQQSFPVPSGQPRTTPKQPRPAPFPAFAVHDPGRSGLGSRKSLGRSLIGIAVPGWPTRSLVAEAGAPTASARGRPFRRLAAGSRGAAT